MRRKIPLDKLQGVTMSKHPESQEIVIHIQTEHDLRVKSERYY